MNNYLEVGDVVEIKKGMKIYATLEERFIFCNTPISSKLKITDIEVGKLKGHDSNIFDTSIFKGEYVVVSTSHYEEIKDENFNPYQFKVICKKLNDDGSYNENGTVISFYQEGFYSAVIKTSEIQPIRKMKMKFE
jgi:hypothetical protein